MRLKEHSAEGLAGCFFLAAIIDLPYAIIADASIQVGDITPSPEMNAGTKIRPNTKNDIDSPFAD